MSSRFQTIWSCRSPSHETSWLPSTSPTITTSTWTLSSSIEFYSRAFLLTQSSFTEPLPLKHLLPFPISSIILSAEILTLQTQQTSLKFWLYKPNKPLWWPLSLHYSTINPYLWSILWICNCRWISLKPHNWKYWITSRPIFHHLLLPDPTYDAHGIGLFGVATHDFGVLTLFHWFYVSPTCVSLCWLLSFIFFVFFHYDSLCFLFSVVIIDTFCYANFDCTSILWLSVCAFVICDISLFLIMTKGWRYMAYIYVVLCVFLDICLM